MTDRIFCEEFYKLGGLMWDPLRKLVGVYTSLLATLKYLRCAIGKWMENMNDFPYFYLTCKVTTIFLKNELLSFC